MWKALSLAIGVTLVMIGIELFFVEELEVRKIRRDPAESQVNGSLFQTASFKSALNPNDESQAPTTLVQPRDWMPWSLLAVGSIIVIYTFTIPGRRGV